MENMEYMTAEQEVDLFCKSLTKEQMLGVLTPREIDVIFLRFGIGEKWTRTLEEIGHFFGVTRQRIRQIEARALRKIRQFIYKKKCHL